jgi:RNA polymerase sigma-54 factor
MKTSLNLQLVQRLGISPQLRKVIELLQLSNIELLAEIQKNFETNPMLEKDDEVLIKESQNACDENNTKERTAEEIAKYLENIFTASPDGSYKKSNIHDLVLNQASSSESLQSHLQWQLNMAGGLRPEEKVAGMAIIDAINDDGYLNEPYDELCKSAADELRLSKKQVNKVLQVIQEFDPVGCASRTVSECLAIQIKALQKSTSCVEKAILVVENDLESVAKNDTKKICRNYNLAEEQVDDIFSLIKSLNPKPGASISKIAPKYIIPDVYVRKIDNSWAITLNPDLAPKIHINEKYASLIQKSDRSKDNLYMKEKLQDAKWFLQNLNNRNETLLKVTEEIVKAQKKFLEYGDEQMQPLILEDIAKKLKMHESTISRATAQKYLHTPKGIYELKYFFSNYVNAKDGSPCSATSIKAVIKKLVDEELATDPLSDIEITKNLSKQGIILARRTVAKYRSEMNILSVSERKKIK